MAFGPVNVPGVDESDFRALDEKVKELDLGKANRSVEEKVDLLDAKVSDLNTEKADAKGGCLTYDIDDGIAPGTVELRTLGATGNKSLGLAVKHESGTFLHKIIDEHGRCGFVKSSTGKAVGSAKKPVYVNESGTVAPCQGTFIVGVQTVTLSSSETAPPGTSLPAHGMFEKVDGATSYVAVPQITQFGCGVSGISITGTELTATLFSVCETHTLKAKFLILALA